MTRWVLALIIFGGGLLSPHLSPSTVQAELEEKGEPAEVVKPGVVLPATRDQVWNELTRILKARELPIARADQPSGKIKTKTKRYFRILSAKFPTVESDYKDTYTIHVTDEESATRVHIERKFEVYDQKKKKWVAGDTDFEKAGVSVEVLLEDLADSLKPGEESSP